MSEATSEDARHTRERADKQDGSADGDVVEPEVAEPLPADDAAAAAESSTAEAQPTPSDAATPSPDERLAELQAEVDAWRDKYLRARADYDNLERRQQREAALERERNKARVLEDFLTVFEYGKMAEAEADKHPGPLSEGVKMVVREFERLLEREGVQAIGTVGEAFDAERHEAVAEEAADGVEPGHVSRVVRSGYLLGERVLRFAKVAVAPAEEK